MNEEKTCMKCKEDFSKDIQKNGIEYLGIDEHHNPPQYMFKKDETWKGKIISLCRKDHKELHKEILKIVHRFSNLFKKNKSEHWTWKFVIGDDKKLCREETVKFTEELIR